MNTAILNVMLPALMAVIPDSVMKSAIDALLDKIEDAAANSPNPFDDVLVNALCGKIRSAFQVPDND